MSNSAVNYETEKKKEKMEVSTEMNLGPQGADEFVCLICNQVNLMLQGFNVKHLRDQS